MPLRLLLLASLCGVLHASGLTSFEAFQKAAVVLRHPRCLNCHIPGDAPLNGSSGAAHPMRVKRGVDGTGMAGLHCNTCHQETNGELPHSPPGAPEWQLPPAKTRMAWSGLNDQKLCRVLLDPKENAGIGREKMIHHMSTDPRVLWAWSPGPGREAPPMEHREFVALITTWIEKGGSCGSK